MNSLRRLGLMVGLGLGLVGQVLAGTAWRENMSDVSEWGLYQATFTAQTNGTAVLAKTGTNTVGSAYVYCGYYGPPQIGFDVGTYRYLVVDVAAVSGTGRVFISAGNDVFLTNFIRFTQPGIYVTNISKWFGNWTVTNQIGVMDDPFVKLQLEGGTNAYATFNDASIVSRTNDLVLTSYRGLNYVQPQSFMRTFWSNYNHDVADRDLGLAKYYGFQVNRLFIPYYTFGGGQLYTSTNHLYTNRMAQLADYIELNRKYGFKVIPVLFDGDYLVENVSYEPGTYQRDRIYINDIVSRYKDDPIIYAWNLKNEIDNDYDIAGTNKVKDWAWVMTTFLTSVDSNHPVSISYGGETSGLDRDTWTNSEDLVDFNSIVFNGRPAEQMLDVITNCCQKSKKPLVINEVAMHSDEGWALDPKNEQSQLHWFKEVEAYIDARGVSNRAITELIWTLSDLDPALELFPDFPGFNRYEKYMGMLRYPDQTVKPVGAFLAQRTQGVAWRENFDFPGRWIAGGGATMALNGRGSMTVTAPPGGGGYILFTSVFNRITLTKYARQELAVIARRADGGAFFKVDEGSDFLLTMLQYDLGGNLIGEFPTPIAESTFRQNSSYAWFVDLATFAWASNAFWVMPKFTFASDGTNCAIDLDMLQIRNYELIPETAWDKFADVGRWNATNYGGTNTLFPNGNGSADLLLEGPAGWGNVDSLVRLPIAGITSVCVDVNDIGISNSYGVAFMTWDANGSYVTTTNLFEYYQYEGTKKVVLTNINWSTAKMVSPRILYAGGPGEITFNSFDIGIRDEVVFATNGGLPYVVEDGKARKFTTGLIYSNRYGFTATNITYVAGNTISTMPAGDNIEDAAFVDRFSPKKATWRDAVGNPSFQAWLNQVSNGTVKLVVSNGVWGKALSAVMTTNVDFYPVLEVKMNQIDAGAIFEGVIQQEVSPYKAYKVIPGKFGPGRYAIDIRKLTGWTGNQTFSIGLYLTGQGKSAIFDSVELRTLSAVTDTLGFTDDFTAPTPWRDETINASYNAYFTDLRDGTARISKPVGSTWGKVLSNRLFVDLTYNRTFEVVVGDVPPGCHAEANIQMEEDTNFTHYTVFPNITTGGMYTTSFTNFPGLTGRRALSVELVIADTSTGTTHSAIFNKVAIRP